MPSVGPQLPPHLAKRKRDGDHEADSSSSLSPDSAKRPCRVIGPAPPPAPMNERPTVSSPLDSADFNPEHSEGDQDTESSDDDGFGPALPSAVDATEKAPVPQPSSIRSQSTAPAKRDDWMTIAPSSGDWSARVDPTKLKNRKFGSGKGPAASVGGGDSWHETPEQKQARLHREMMGIKDESKATPGKRAATRQDPEDEATRRRIREYNAARGPSLYQVHQAGTKAEEEDDPSARAFDREKDIGGGLQINPTQRRDMMKKASDFGSRFSSAKHL